MIKIKSYFIRSSLILFIFAAAACSPGYKTQKTPIKPYSSIDIPDGTFLHYGNYAQGEKYGDTYMVIKKETNSGVFYYRIYKIDTKIRQEKKIPLKYKDWPSTFLIDPARGSVIEAAENTGLEASDNKDEKFSNYDYKFYPGKGYADFILKTKKNGIMKETRYHVKVNPDFPTWDNLSMYYALCFLDYRSGGIMYLVNAAFFKDPMPLSFRLISKENLTTKAGIFGALKMKMTVPDPFLSRLLGPVLEGSSIWIEDSDRRLLLKGELSGDTGVLEDISNINSK